MTVLEGHCYWCQEPIYDNAPDDQYYTISTPDCYDLLHVLCLVDMIDALFIRRTAIHGTGDIRDNVT